MLQQSFRNTPRAPSDCRGSPGRPARTGAIRARGRSAGLPFPEVVQWATGGGFLASHDEDDGRRARGPRPAADARRPGERPARLRVLIAEDEAVISMELEDMLEGLGWEVVGVAHTAEEAIRLADRERPDLVTMDVNLPGGGDGVTAAKEIFDRYGLRSLFITAYSDPETVARARPARPLGWLRKPLTLGGLAAALKPLSDNGG